MMYAVLNKYDHVRRVIICDNSPCMAAAGYKAVYYKNQRYEFARATDMICCNDILYIHANDDCLFRIIDQQVEMIYQAVGKREITFKIISENEYLLYYEDIIRDYSRLCYVKEGIIKYDIPRNNFFLFKGKIISVQEESKRTSLVGFDYRVPQQKWTFIIPDEDKFDRRLAHEHNLLVFITKNQWLYALEATSGQLVWKTKAKFRIYHYNPANRTLFGIGGSYLEVFDFMNGRLIHTADLTTVFAPYDMHLLSHMGAVAGDTYYFTHNAYPVLFGQINISSGTLEHIQALNSELRPFQVGPPVINKQRLYLLANHETLYEFEMII